MNATESADIVIIGSGAGGGTLARTLAGSGARVLILERGGTLPTEPENWSPAAVFEHHRYKPDEHWEDREGKPFQPGVHYYVGGNTKVYGAALPRLREEDFGSIEHEGGTSPEWPISYSDLEPFYRLAEQWYLVHGKAGVDPTEPWRSSAYPFEPVPTDSYMQTLADAFARQGLHPYPMPLGLDYRIGGRCIRCRTCDAFPCQVRAKGDAEVCGIEPALQDPDISLWTNTYVTRLLTDATGTIVDEIELVRDGARQTIRAGTVVVAAGAVNSAALLLRSANYAHPHGLGNGSGQVGRNYMVHNMTIMMAAHPEQINPTVVQKTFAINDFYFRGPGFPYPLGNLQPVGKIQGAMLKPVLRMVPDSVLEQIAARSTDWNVMSEDLPDPNNRVSLGSEGRIRITWTPNNQVAHRRLIETAKTMFAEAGYPVVLSRTMGLETNSHQVGTLRFGHDPATSVLDPFSKAHELQNLYVVDGSFFPSSAAVNPALTIMAQAIRVGCHLCDRSLESLEAATATESTRIA